MGTLSSKWFKICSRERFGIELCIGSPPQEYMLGKAIGVDEIKQEKEWAEQRPRHSRDPQRLQTPKEEHHEWMA